MIDALAAATSLSILYCIFFNLVWITNCLSYFSVISAVVCFKSSVSYYRIVFYLAETSAIVFMVSDISSVVTF